MKKKDIDRMISLIDDEKLAASEKAAKRKIKWTRVAAAAACAAIVLSSALVFVRFGNRGSHPGGDGTVRMQILSTEATAYCASELIAGNTEFLIKTENGSLEELEKKIYLDPPVEYSLKEVADNEFLLTPEQELPDNTVVSLAEVKNSKVTNSWAYQTKKDLSVSEVYPRNGVDGVSPNSVIEIVLSYADVEDFEGNVTITPEIPGSWEHEGKLWRFKPKSALKKDTMYTVSISAGYSNGSLTAEEPYSFSFGVSDTDNGKELGKYDPVNISADGIFSFLPDETMSIPFSTERNRPEISRISIQQFEDADGFMATLRESSASVKYTDMGDMPFTWENMTNDTDHEDTAVFNKKLPEGYYLAHIYDTAGIERSQAFIQVNSISAYALETNKEALVWAAKDKKLAEGLSVTYNGETVKTDSDGIARFAMSDDEGMKYALVGDERPLVIGLAAFDGEQLNGYIYTDRPLYREDDLIQVWGCVPPEMIPDENAEFKVAFGSSVWGEYEKEIRVTPDEFGCFKAEYQMKDHSEGSMYVSLFCNDSCVTSRYVEIKNYSGQYYSYEIIPDKNYAIAGTQFGVDVKVTHLSGKTVSGKRVFLNDETAVTDENGIAHFTLTAAVPEYPSGAQYDIMDLNVSNGAGTEHNGYAETECIYVFDHDIAMIDEIESEDVYTFKAYRLDFNSDVSTDNIENGEQLIRSIGTLIANGELAVTVVESKSARVITGYDYDEYTKENVPRYDTVYTDTEVYNQKLKIENGYVKVDLSDIDYKKPGLDESYSYIISATAASGASSSRLYRTSYKYSYYNANRDLQNRHYSSMYQPYWSDGSTSVPMAYIYHGYRFETGDTDYVKKYAAGDEVSLALIDKNEDTPQGGTVLRTLWQNGIVAADILTDMNGLSFKYPEGIMPGVYAGGAYFKDGVFYRIPGEYIRYDYESNELDITVSADKEEYAPGDEVTLDISVSDSGGKGVSSEVSVSVVNEAVLKLGEADTELAQRLFEDISYRRYTYSSMQDRTLTRTGSGWGDGRGPQWRCDFGDTAYFDSVKTDENGHATVKFKLPDTVTSYRVTAQAVSHGMKTGVDVSYVGAKLDFFIQHTEPKNVKVMDDLVVGACAVGGDETAFTFTLKETGETVNTSAKDSQMVYANFGKLPLGTYTVQISAESGEYSDGVEYTVEIISTAQTVRSAKKTKIRDGESISPAKNPIVIEICNSDMTKYQEYLDYLQGTVNERLDTQIGYREAVILQNQYRGENSYVPGIDFGKYSAECAGYGAALLAPLASAEADPLLSALAAYYIGADIDTGIIITDNRIDAYDIALLQAAKKEPVLAELKHLAAAAEDDREKLYVSLAYAFLGDYGSAKASYVQTDDRSLQSLQAIAATFIDRENAVSMLDELTSARPKDKYLRFAVISYLRNNAELIESEESVVVEYGDKAETVTVNGLEVKRLVLNSDDISKIKFTSASENIDITYYYDTALDRLDGNDVINDIKAYFDGEPKVDSEVYLNIDINISGASRVEYGYITVALPNNVRMMSSGKYGKGYSVVDKVDHIIVYVSDETPNIIQIPLAVICEGEYEFEPVVLEYDGDYHISESFTYRAD